MRESATIWVLRGLWLTLPLTVGAALADALPTTSLPGPAVAGGAWALWAATLLALLVPHPLTLTAARIVVPAAVPVAAWALVAAEPDPLRVIGLVVAGLATLVVLLPATGDLFVDGASYGSERRFALRTPAALWMGPVPLTWAVAVAGALAGPLLVAGGHRVAGAAALVVGWPLAAAAVRALHGLSRRWLVFVPAGFVIHDLATLADPVLVRSGTVRGIEPAPAPGRQRAPGEPAPTFGPALAVTLAPPLSVSLRGASLSEVHHLDRVVVCPTRPGAVLVEAAARSLPVGAP